MARPRYIICCNDVLLDQSTQLASLVSVIDRIELLPLKPPPPPADENVKYLIPPLDIGGVKLISVWMREDGDNAEAEYEHEIVITDPIDGPRTVGTGQFTFRARFHRIQANIRFNMSSRLPNNGITIFENRIREIGTSDWLSQSFPIEVEVHRESAVAQEKSANQQHP